MRRLFWLAMGASIGALIVRKLSTAAQQLTPGNLLGNLAEGIRDLGAAVRDFTIEVREGMREREEELRDGVGLDGRLDAKPEDFRH
ncbi:MAG: hypothetical protein H0T66_20050 [Geodermatophilaceae bacterium]|nr:hypothetical protein [Geodermatophilaceae bacterium]MDQ3456139.1 hypothetical protein [Actinomycetota bacterium]